ncbi:MAG: WYL domain-containing protein [bacterium]
MRHDKAAVVIELARRMAASAEGLTLEEMARECGVGRRTAERMRDAVLALYPAAEEVSDPPTKRWRIRGGLSAFEQAPTTEELVELSKAAQGLRAATSAVQAGPRPAADEAGRAEFRQAILAGQPLGFIYSRPGAEARRRSVAPCGVMFGRANYLVAADRETGRVQTFRLDRMSAVRAEEGVAAPPADFDLQAFASQSFGIYQDEIEDVVLRVTPGGAAEARAWRWHPTQTVEDRADGGVEVRFRASGMRELAWHLFSWGEQVEIVAPARLKAMMSEALKAAQAALDRTG